MKLNEVPDFIMLKVFPMFLFVIMVCLTMVTIKATWFIMTQAVLK